MQMQAAVSVKALMPKQQLNALQFCRYPYNLDFDYGALDGLTKYSINNLGDPFIESNYGVHSREFEVSIRTCNIFCASYLDQQPGVVVLMYGKVCRT